MKATASAQRKSNTKIKQSIKLLISSNTAHSFFQNFMLTSKPNFTVCQIPLQTYWVGYKSTVQSSTTKMLRLALKTTLCLSVLLDTSLTLLVLSL